MDGATAVLISATLTGRTLPGACRELRGEQRREGGRWREKKGEVRKEKKSRENRREEEREEGRGNEEDEGEASFMNEHPT